MESNNKSKSLPWVEVRDVAYLMVLPVLALLAWATPQRYWPVLSRTLVRTLFLGPEAAGKTLTRRIETALKSTDLGASPRSICRSYVSNKLLLQFEYFRALRPGGWSCSIMVEGNEHLEAAMGEGKGVILWITPSSSSDLVVKRALFDRGFKVAHLSDLTHGYSASRFGVSCINSVNRLVENRYLDRRIILDREQPSAAVRQIQKHVLQGETVSITAVENKGGKSAEVALFHCRLPLGMGAITIARKTGAALLPVFTRRQANSSYRVEIGPPLDVRSGKPDEILRRFAKLVEAHARSSPEQWYGWTHLRCDSGSVSGRRTLWDWINKAPRD